MITISLLSVPSHAEVKNEFNMILPAGDKEIANIANIIVKQLDMTGIEVNLYYLPVEDYFPQLMENDFWDMSLFLYPKIELRDYRHIYSNNSFFGDKILKINSIADELLMMNTSVSVFDDYFDLIDNAKSFEEIEGLVANLTEIYFDKLLYDIPLLAVQEFSISNVEGFNLTKGYWGSLPDINQNFSIYYPEANSNPFFITDETLFTTYLLHKPLFYADQFGNLSPGFGSNITMKQYANDSLEINFIIDGQFGNESITFDDLEFTLDLLQLSKTNTPDKEFHKRISFMNHFANTSLVISNFTFFDYESLSRLFLVPKTQLNTQLHAIEGEDVIEFAPLSNRLDPFTSFEFSNYFYSENITGEFWLNDYKYQSDEITIGIYSDDDPNLLFNNNFTDIIITRELENFNMQRSGGEQFSLVFNLGENSYLIRERIMNNLFRNIMTGSYLPSNTLFYSFPTNFNPTSEFVVELSLPRINIESLNIIEGSDPSKAYLLLLIIPILGFIFYINEKLKVFERK